MSIRDTSIRSKIVQKLLDVFGEAPLNKESQARQNRLDAEVESVNLPADLLV